MKESFLFLAPGFEETEALATVDILRRAGMTVSTVSIADRQVTGAHGITVVADTTFAEADFTGADWLICPGGMPGSPNLHAFEPLGLLLKEHFSSGGNIAAICASPALVLAPLGILCGREATCYPGLEPEAAKHGAIMRPVPVVALPGLITAHGPAATMAFALAIARQAQGDKIADDTAAGLLYKA